VGELLLMSHFASAEEPSGAAARMQLRAFNDVAKSLRLERSMANSAGIIDWPDAHFEWVRPGIALYGISPLENKSAASLGLRPAMTLTTRLIAIQDVQAGEAVGYYGVWRAPRRSRIGVAAIGYGDGYPRGMRGGAPVLVTGREAPVVGRVSMDMMTVDVTDLPDAKVGDTVTLWGEGLPSERVAAYADTLGYELVCRVTERVAMRWK
jgi:alanine racemase